MACTLRASAKDCAENVMIVDVLRNDFGRVCTPGSIEVPELFGTEGHPSVWQLVSEVRGELPAGVGAVDLLRACSPGGSVTGAQLGVVLAGRVGGRFVLLVIALGLLAAGVRQLAAGLHALH